MRPAVAPADARAALRRLTGSWTQPEPWTVAILLVTGVLVGARHPLARMIGTEVDDAPVASSVVAAAPVVPASAPTAGPSAAAAVAAAPTHAPRDPFRALVKAGDAALAPPAILPAGVVAATNPAASNPPAATSKTTPDAPTPVAAAGSCTGTSYRVAAGDTLWTIAARAVKSSDGSRISIAWHRIYQANRPPLGPDPSVLAVGVKLCLPDKL